MSRPKGSTFVFLVVSLVAIAPLVRPQEAQQFSTESVQTEREAMYYRYLEFASLGDRERALVERAGISANAGSDPG